MAKFDWWREDEPEATSVQAIVDRVQAEWRAERGEGEVGAESVSTHAAPDLPFDIEGAHRTMQQHRMCNTSDCPRKHSAWRTLIDSGRVTPDSRRNY